MPQPNGSFLIAGQGGGPQPGSGRPRNEWMARLQRMTSRDEVLDHVETVLLAGPTDPFFKDALNYATEHGWGRATQVLEVNATLSVADSLTAARQRALNRGEVAASLPRETLLDVKELDSEIVDALD